MSRWVSKIRELGEKRRRYEDLFQRQISEVDGDCLLYTSLTSVLKFADLLPIKDDSLSAALGHLANLAKIGYYPTDPVSYTHLDVYKRQPTGPPC